MDRYALTLDRLRAILSYDAGTGVFTYRCTRGRMVRGDIAGQRGSTGYVEIRLNGRKYGAHRLAWFYVFGAWPTWQIDHIDGIRTNNAIANLREASDIEQRANTGPMPNNKLGIRGVQRAGRKFSAHIGTKNSRRHLGTFLTLEDARNAYEAAAFEKLGNFAKHRAALASAPSAKEGQPGEQSGDGK